MKKIITFVCLLFSVFPLYAQAPGFNKRFEGPYPNSTVYKILIENDTITALGDGCLDITCSEKGIVLMKFDTLGNLLASNYIYDSSFSTLFLHIRWGSILKTNDGGYIMNFIPFLYAAPALLKVDSGFNFEYILLNQELDGYNYQVCDMIKLSDGYLLFGGFNRPNGKKDGFIKKFDTDLNAVWSKAFGNMNEDEGIVDVDRINDSLYAVAMVKVINPSMFNGSAVSLVKYVNANGDILQEWESEPEPEIGYLREIIFADEDHLLLYGLYVDSVLFNGTYVFKSTISKLDAEHNVLWVKHYGKQVGLSSEIMLYNFDNTIDGNYIGVGVTYIEQDTSSPLDCGWLMKFSPNGDSIWSRLDLSDLMPVHYTNNNRLGGVGVLSSGSIIAGGYAERWPDSYIWLIKVTNDGCLDTLYCGLVSGVKEEVPEPETKVTVYPNPAQNDVTISFNRMPLKAIQLAVYDVQGRKWLEQDYGSEMESIVFHIEQLPSSLYIVQVKVEGDKPFQFKLSVQH